MPRLSTHERSEALGMLRAGSRISDVARQYNCHRSTILRLRERFQTTGGTNDRPRPGQPRITTPLQDANVRQVHRRNRFTNASTTARQTIGIRGRPVHPSTIRRRLAVVGLRCRRPKKGSILTDRHKAGRRGWARAHARWTRRQWGAVMFSDESKFNVQSCDGRARVYRETGERFLEECVQKVNRGGGGSVHVWAGINQFQKTQLVILVGNVNARRYIVDVLRPVAVPFLRQNHLTLQHDNAPAHRARLTTAYLAANGIQPMQWPSLSPDPH